MATRRFVGVLSVIGLPRQLASFLHTGAAALLTGKQLSLTCNSITMKLEAN